MTNPDSITPTKICTTCGKELPATTEYFSRKKTGKYGLDAKCKRCRHAYRVEHQDSINAYNAIYHAAHREKERAWTAAYHAQHREDERARAAAYRKANPEKVRAYNASRAEMQRVYHIEHYEERRAYAIAYRASPQGKVLRKAAHHRRRALKARSGGSYTQAELDAVLKAHTHPKTGKLICALCGKPIKGNYHIDHFIPLILGGTNDAGNLRITHQECNLHKSAKHPHKIGVLI